MFRNSSRFIFVCAWVGIFVSVFPVMQSTLRQSSRSEMSAWIRQVGPAVQTADSFLPNPVPIPEFPGGVDWINTSSRLQLSDLRGKLILLDFWTYCCINCMHLLPVLEQAEKKYDRQLVVVGVHTPKFDAEKDTKNVRDAIMRYEIKHPVLNDSQEILWKKFGVATWPTLILVDPDGRAIWAHAGEISFANLDRVLARAVERYQNRLDSRLVRFDLAIDQQPATQLRFPGKIAIDSINRRIAISDSNHNRIVIADPNGKLLAVVGNGQSGRTDGSYETASFHHPQGLAFSGENLFVADTGNHLLRRINLANQTVATVAGTGQQTRNPWKNLDHSQPLATQNLNRIPLRTDLGSPWDLLVHGNSLYIAMAGPHQIWTMTLDEKSIGVYAGSGREDIIDGLLLPRSQFSARTSTFAQPSGLASDGDRVFVADSEGSSIRSVPFDPAGSVSTVVGTSQLFDRRLFTFGLKDGPFEQALMQHPLGVAYHSGKLYVADTYNNAIRVIDLAKQEVSTLIGDGQPGNTDTPPRLDEPSSVNVLDGMLYIADTNNHSVRVFDLNAKTLRTLAIDGLTPPAETFQPTTPVAPVPKLPTGVATRTAPALELSEQQTELEMEVEFVLPKGWKLNELAPLRYVAAWRSPMESGLLPESVAGKFATVSNKVYTKVSVPSAASLTLEVGLTYYFCRSDGKGLCLADGVAIKVPITRKQISTPSKLQIRQSVRVSK